MKLISMILLAVVCVPQLREAQEGPPPAQAADWEQADPVIGSDGLQASVQRWLDGSGLKGVFSYGTVDRIRKLEEFCAVAETPDKTEAVAVIASVQDGSTAMRVLRVQNSAAYALARLEQELGWELFRPSQ